MSFSLPARSSGARKDPRIQCRLHDDGVSVMCRQLDSWNPQEHSFFGRNQTSNYYSTPSQVWPGRRGPQLNGTMMLRKVTGIVLFCTDHHVVLCELSTFCELQTELARYPEACQFVPSTTNRPAPFVQQFDPKAKAKRLRVLNHNSSWKL